MRQEIKNANVGQIIARAWSDDAFKRTLLNDATAALKAEDIDVPDGVEIRAVENTENVMYLVVPRQPVRVPLSDDQLASVAGGCNDCPCGRTGGGGCLAK